MLKIGYPQSGWCWIINCTQQHVTMTIQVTRGSAVAGNIAEADTFCFQLQAGGGGRRLEAASSITASDLRPQPRMWKRRVIRARLGMVEVSASKSSIRRFVITQKAPTRAFSWLKAATIAFTFKTLLRHYANQTARSLWPLRRGPNFTLRDRGVNARLA